MPAFVTRLDLVNGKVLQIGHFWPGEESIKLEDGRLAPAPAHTPKVGLICPQDEVATPDDAGGMFTRAARYDVWMFPDELRDAIYEFFFHLYAQRVMPDKKRMTAMMRKYPTVFCREVKEDRVEFAQKNWPIMQAWMSFDEYFEAEFTPDESEEPEQEPVQAQLQPPQQPSAVNGPQQQT
jgi:hypothetical protein